jgi:hypothetical protein
MIRRTLINLLALGLVTGTAHGSSFLDRAYGTPEAGQSVRSRAMGGAGAALAQGPGALVENPGALALAHGSQLQLSATLSRASENRFVPLFDTFDSYVDEQAIAINDHDYGSLNGGVVLDRGWPGGMVVAAGVFDRLDPRYDYRDERRTTATTDEIVAERFISTTGMLRSASLGVAWPLPHRTSFGAAVHWYTGTITHRDALVPFASTVTGRVTKLERKLSGTSFGLGGTYQPDERLTTALSLETMPFLNDDFTRWENDSIVSAPNASTTLRLPWRVQGGWSYRPRNALRTTFAMDVAFTRWEKVSDRIDPALDLLDTWDVRFGVEHIYYNTLPARIGFRYARSYEMREADRATLTFGAGYKLERFTLDVAAEVGKRNSRQEPLWPRAEQGPAVGAGRDRVEDTLVRLVVGVQAGF